MKPTFLPLLLFLSLPSMLYSSSSATCTISNCAVHFSCHNCSEQNTCSAFSTISNLTIRPSSCSIYQSGNDNQQKLCQVGCRYCFSQQTQNQSVQVCTICDSGYEMQYDKCFPALEVNVDVVYTSIQKKAPTTSYLDYIDNSIVQVSDKLAVDFEFNVQTKVFTSIFAVAVISYVVYSEYQPFIRFILCIQHLYHFSFKELVLPSSQQYFLSFMNIFNVGFLNEVIYFLPRSYFEPNQSETYFILNTDHNLIRNTGGSLLVYFLIITALICLAIFQLAKKVNVLMKYSNKIMILWALIHNNLIYFSIYCLITTNNDNSDTKISLTLRIVSGIIILIYLFGIFLIYKLFNNTLHNHKVQKYQLLGSMLNHLFVNILLCFGQKSTSQYFVLLIHVLYIIVMLYYLKNATHHKSKSRFVVSQWFSLTLQMSIVLGIQQSILIGEVVAYLLLTVWDVILTKHEIKMIDDLNDFKNGGSNNPDPHLILMTEADMISYPTMKKLHSAASTDA